MKIALVHDWLTSLAGAEKVLEAIYEIYPAPIYTLVADNEKLSNSSFETSQIITSFIQALPYAQQLYRNYLPLFPLAIEQFDLSSYDVIISSSHAVAKGVLSKTDQLHICYCHTPIRYAWDLYHEYLRRGGLLKGLKGFVSKLILHYIRVWDYVSAGRVDYFVANSNYVADRIGKIYGRQAKVIYPPVDIDKFELNTKKSDFYLTVSRMVPYKRVDLIVEAFSRLRDRKLIVIGDGPELAKIRKNASKNIEFLGYQPFEVLKNYLKDAKAFIFAAVEDFGIAPVEAQACGTPVIAYGKGGVTETVLEGKTGIFFKTQTVEGLLEAIREFERMEAVFSPEEIRKNAERFSKKRFQKEFKAFVEEKVADFFKGK